MAWSEVHANFLVNFGGGTYAEADSLLKEAAHRVKILFGISLKEEIKRL
jgi:UDP-N-acetylmuramate dehydrogenase